MTISEKLKAVLKEAAEREWGAPCAVATPKRIYNYGASRGASGGYLWECEIKIPVSPFTINAVGSQTMAQAAKVKNGGFISFGYMLDYLFDE